MQPKSQQIKNIKLTVLWVQTDSSMRIVTALLECFHLDIKAELFSHDVFQL